MIREAILLLTSILGGILALVIYLLPSYLAFKRKNPYKVWLLIVNVLLGWTLIGYIVVLIWALYGEGKNKFNRRQIS